MRKLPIDKKRRTDDIIELTEVYEDDLMPEVVFNKFYGGLQ